MCHFSHGVSMAMFCLAPRAERLEPNGMRMGVLNCVNVMTLQDPKPYAKGCLEFRYCFLGGGFKYFSCSSLPEKGFHFD